MGRKKAVTNKITIKGNYIYKNGLSSKIIFGITSLEQYFSDSMSPLPLSNTHSEKRKLDPDTDSYIKKPSPKKQKLDYGFSKYLKESRLIEDSKQALKDQTIIQQGFEDYCKNQQFSAQLSKELKSTEITTEEVEETTTALTGTVSEDIISVVQLGI